MSSTWYVKQVRFEFPMCILGTEEMYPKTEPWTVSQRWRSITAKHTFKLLEPAKLEDDALNLASWIADVIVWSYSLPSAAYLDLQATTKKHLTTLFQDSLELSLLIKRDILSVRMFVTRAEGIEGDFAPFDSQQMDSVWPEMGPKSGDAVLGTYKLGLAKSMEGGGIVHLSRPQVITAALLREVNGVENT